MSCLFCQEEKVVTDDNGTCSICSIAVCGPPAQRLDGTVHGAACACSCRKFVCDADMLRHVRAAHPGGSVAVCFEEFADLIGPAAVVAAAVLKSAMEEGTYDAERNAPELRTLSRFVNAFLVSDDEVERAASVLGADGLLSVERVPGGPGRVVLTPHAMSGDAADRLLTAAANYRRLSSEVSSGDSILGGLDVSSWAGAASLVRPSDEHLSLLADKYLIQSMAGLEKWAKELGTTEVTSTDHDEQLQTLDAMGQRVRRAALGSAEIRDRYARVLDSIRLDPSRGIGALGDD